jgi:phage terminase large subunit-like protein
MPQVRWSYGQDPSGLGFFCPQLPQKQRDYFALKLLRPAEAETVYQCRPGARIGSIFVQADFRYFDPPQGLEYGMASRYVLAWVRQQTGWVVQAWDTALSASSDADWSVGVTGLLVPCQQFHRDVDAAILGECDPHYDVYILDILRDRLDIGDLANAMRSYSLKWAPEKILIEKRAHGSAAIQALYNSGLPVEGVETHESKRDRAINGGSGAGSAQGWYRSGRVQHPKPDAIKLPWVLPMERELKDFTGERGGVDDQTDAIVHLINHAIVEGSSSLVFPSGWGSIADVDRNMRYDPAAPFIEMDRTPVEKLVEDGLVLDPFAYNCGRCMSFYEDKRPTCQFHQRMVSALHPACEAFDDGSTLTSFPRF